MSLTIGRVQLRRLTWSSELAQGVLRLREQYPRWGKDKLVVLLHRAGWQVCTSMVGRILTHLKARGVLKEPLGTGISTVSGGGGDRPLAGNCSINRGVEAAPSNTVIGIRLSQ